MALPKDTRTVRPTYTSAVNFPVTVRIPAQIAVATDGVRVIRIASADQHLPALAVEWLRGVPRYGHWFADVGEPPPSSGGGDDFTIVKGIGAATAQKLYAAGITTFAQLAATDPAEIDRIVDSKTVTEERAAKFVEEATKLAQGT